MNYKKMTIDVYATCYNEEIILPYFIRHYKQFARNITIYDNMSTDNSLNIIKEAGDINVIQFDTNNKFEESVLINIRNNCWKDSDADWVIVCDTDEFIYHENLLEKLSSTDATHIITSGYEMMSEDLPTTNGQIYGEIKIGHHKPTYSKPCLFKPSEIKEINFAPGSHAAKPSGNVISINDSGIKLLHYKYLNRDVLIKKYQHYAIRQSQEMKLMGWGNYQQWTADVLNKQFDDWFLISENIID
jgi:glycosyltransferase involved in cell wall biosynthesis